MRIVWSGVCLGGKSERTFGNNSGGGISRGAGRSGNGRKSSGTIRSSCGAGSRAGKNSGGLFFLFGFCSGVCSVFVRVWKRLWNCGKITGKVLTYIDLWCIIEA